LRSSIFAGPVYQHKSVHVPKRLEAKTDTTNLFVLSTLEKWANANEAVNVVPHDIVIYVVDGIGVSIDKDCGVL
jgi:hypothetical protein